MKSIHISVSLLEFKIVVAFLGIYVTGPPGALLFDVKPEIALKESL